MSPRPIVVGALQTSLLQGSVVGSQVDNAHPARGGNAFRVLQNKTKQYSGKVGNWFLKSFSRDCRTIDGMCMPPKC